MRGFVWYKNWFFLLVMAIVLMVCIGARKWVVIGSFGIGVSNELTPVPSSISQSNDGAEDDIDKKNEGLTKTQIRTICEENIEVQAGNQLDTKAYCDCALPIFYKYLDTHEIKQSLEGIPCNKVPEAAYIEIRNCIGDH
jgi:hypothetical protein